MSVFAIADPHLSLGCEKPMDVFAGWENYDERLFKNWRSAVRDADTVIIAGDISWAMTLEEALPDFRALNGLPGHKIILKGNHDYWWSTRAKLEAWTAENALDKIDFLLNDAYEVENLVICGTRSWFYDKRAEQKDKVFLRELGRLESSLSRFPDSELERVAFLHYPPIFGGVRVDEIVDMLESYGVRRCYYGHVHGASIGSAFNGRYRGIDFSLISADFLAFKPIAIN
ncbi:MAG: metallophosphoesterase [Oscillospiraceae bacterium]